MNLWFMPRCLTIHRQQARYCAGTPLCHYSGDNGRNRAANPTHDFGFPQLPLLRTLKLRAIPECLRLQIFHVIAPFCRGDKVVTKINLSIPAGGFISITSLCHSHFNQFYRYLPMFLRWLLNILRQQKQVQSPAF